MDIVTEALEYCTRITQPKPPRKLSEAEAKVAEINGIDQTVLNEMREGGTSTSKIIREVSNNLFIIDSAADSGDYYKTQQITPTPANVTADSDYGFNTVDSDNISNI